MSIQQLVMAVGGRVNDATGGTITYFGDYQIHTFTSSGTFTVTRAAVPSAVVDVLVVAGGVNGEQGGYSEEPEFNPIGDGGSGGNGGSGGQVTTSSALTLASFNLNTGYTVTVGAVANNSSFAYQSGTLSATTGYLSGGVGGSPFGGGGGTGTTGTTSAITGVSVVYGSSGGGGGGGSSGGAAGTGANGGTNAGKGGNGGPYQNPGYNGDAGTGYGAGGGGGGGAGGDTSTLRSPGNGGAGYQGIVVVRFKYQNV